MPSIDLEKKAGVGWITINHPERLNTFTANMREDLAQSVYEVCQDSAVKAIVLTGEGKAFCAGGNIIDFVEGTTQQKVEALDPLEKAPMHQVMTALHEVEKPVIGAINGVAAGGGAGLALSCDMRIGCDSTRFGFVFTKRGVFPDWGSVYLLPRIIGYAKACDLLFSGDVIDAKRCLDIGLIDRLVTNDKLIETTAAMAEQFANNAPIPMALTKRGLKNAFDWNLSTFIEFESSAMHKTFNTEDADEGFKAFMEKRTPTFKGR